MLLPLERSPGEPAALARAATFYAGTDAAGMALLWGLTHAATAPESGEREAIALAMARVLRERITVTSNDGNSRRVSTRLAPGAMPALARPDGSVHAPVAHVFELQFVPALARFTGEWRLSDAVTAFAMYVAMIEQNPGPLDGYVELHAWLVRLRAAGHLEAFLIDALGPAFPEEHAAYTQSNEAALTAARAYVTEQPLRSSHAVLPDRLVRIR